MNKVKTFSFIGLGIGLFGILSVTAIFITSFFLAEVDNNSSIGIIGGADIPTFRFLFLNLFLNRFIVPIVLSLALIIISTIYLIFNKTANRCCNVKTSAFSIGMSFSIALGVWSFFEWFVIVKFNEMATTPIRYPLSKILGIIALIALITLFVFYCKERKHKSLLGGIILDIITALLLIIPFTYIIEAIDFYIIKT